MLARNVVELPTVGTMIDLLNLNEEIDEEEETEQQISITDVTWIVRDVAGTVGRANSSTKVKKEKHALSKKENEKIGAIADILFPSHGPNSVIKSPHRMELTAEEQTRIKSAQIELAELRCNEAQMGLLTKVADCKLFPHFLDEHQKEIEEDMMEIARNAKRRRLGKSSSDR